MTNCQMKKGFFFLRDCEKEATISCSVCGREFCPEHIRMLPGQNEPACLDCLGKRMQIANRKKSGRSDYDYDDYYYDSSWSYGYRHRYYLNNHYSPLYDGDDFNDNYYSEVDVRSFDDREDDLAEIGNDYQAEANVFDS
ncbi:MAG: hypothetical protein Kow0029_11790 [Candidatus Rifleibacteriota bacterium]